MTLISIVIALAVELFSPASQRWRGRQWFTDYTDWMHGRLSASVWNGPLGVLLVLLPPVLAVALLQSALEDAWLGFLALAFGVGVLLYCLRYKPLDSAVDSFADGVDSGDEERARDAAGEVLDRPLRGAMPGVREMTEAVLVQANERLFAVLFWFVILGPLGAVLYRLASWLGGGPVMPSVQKPEGEDAASELGASVDLGFAASAKRLLGILDWLPARLLAATYALTGSFEDALHEWRSVPDDAVLSANRDILVQSGVGALQLDRYSMPAEEGEEGAPGLEPAALRAARGLVLRSLVVWVSVIALISLAAWAY